VTLEEQIREAVRTELRAELTELRQLLVSRPAGDRYLSTAAAAAHADVHPDTVREWMKAGQLPAHHAGRELRVKLSELEAFMAGAGKSGEHVAPEDEAVRILSRKRR
jgi:excisionase family DNA binding protein